MYIWSLFGASGRSRCGNSVRLRWSDGATCCRPGAPLLFNYVAFQRTLSGGCEPSACVVQLHLPSRRLTAVA
eukprot:14996793-Alexandrium_andersonii.AAC.1